MVRKKRGAFDLNHCTMRQLVQLSGISQGSASKLVRFRRRQWRKAKCMDAARQAQLKRRHDLMAELRQEVPSRYRKARASTANSGKKLSSVQTRSNQCQNITASPLKQMSWLSVSDDRKQTRSSNEEQRGAGMQVKTLTKRTSNKQTSHPESEVPAMKHSPDTAEPHISDSQKPSEASMSLLHSPDVYKNGGQHVSQDGRLFCRVCGAAERYWVTCEQRRHFRSEVWKSECRKRRREKDKKGCRGIETRNSSQGQCVLL